MIIILVASIGVFAQSAAPLSPCNDPAVKAMRQQFLTLDPQTKADLWRAHIEKQLRTRSYNAEQRAALAKALTFFSAGAYQSGTVENAAAQKGLAELNAELHRVFTKDEGAQLFVRIDADVWEKYTSGRLFLDKVNARDSVVCVCATGSDWCPDPMVCCRAGQNLCPLCERTQGGCGVFWFFDCNGMCRPGQEY